MYICTRVEGGGCDRPTLEIAREERVHGCGGDASAGVAGDRSVGAAGRAAGATGATTRRRMRRMAPLPPPKGPEKNTVGARTQESLKNPVSSTATFTYCFTIKNGLPSQLGPKISKRQQNCKKHIFSLLWVCLKFFKTEEPG